MHSSQADLLADAGEAARLLDDLIEFGAVFEQGMQLLKGGGELVIGNELADF